MLILFVPNLDYTHLQVFHPHLCYFLKQQFFVKSKHRPALCINIVFGSVPRILRFCGRISLFRGRRNGPSFRYGEHINRDEPHFVTVYRKLNFLLTNQIRLSLSREVSMNLKVFLAMLLPLDFSKLSKNAL